MQKPRSSKFKEPLNPDQIIDRYIQPRWHMQIRQMPNGCKINLVINMLNISDKKINKNIFFSGINLQRKNVI